MDSLALHPVERVAGDTLPPTDGDRPAPSLSPAAVGSPGALGRAGWRPRTQPPQAPGLSPSETSAPALAGFFVRKLALQYA